MSGLTEKLLSVLESGFSYHALKQIERECASCPLQTGSLLNAVDNVMVFVIGRICYSTGELLGNGPITTNYHAQSEAAIRPPLEAAIRNLENTNIDEKITALDGLVAAYREVSRYYARP